MIEEMLQQARAVEVRLAEATKNAVEAMAAATSQEARKRVLADWEKTLTRDVRPAYKAMSEKLRQNRHIVCAEKDKAEGRVSSLPSTMVADRAKLEGLVLGRGPTKHSAGGAFPPPSNCPPAVRKKARDVLLGGFEEFRRGCDQVVAGELLGDWVRRVEPTLRRATGAAKQILAASGYEYQEILDAFELEATTLFTQAMARRDKSADKMAQGRLQEVRAELVNRLSRFPVVQPEGVDIDRLAEEELSWAKTLISAAQTGHEIKGELGDQLDFFRKELRAKVGECKGAWNKPPEFAIVSRADLNLKGADGGVILSFYPNGHLKEAVAGSMTLRVSQDKPHARYEDSANVAEFHPSGVIEEYGGRYERETRARITFADWVLEQVHEMVRAHAR